MATKLEIKRYQFKQRKFFCNEMLLFRNKNFSQNDTLTWLTVSKAFMFSPDKKKHQNLHVLISVVKHLLLPGNHYAKLWLTNLKDDA